MPGPAESTLATLGRGSRRRRRDGLLGLWAAFGFLWFVSKFNERVQVYKAQKNISAGARIQAGLRESMRAILVKTCGLREAATVAKLSLMLLLRTLGSVWTARHWGRMVNATVGRHFHDLHRYIYQFAGVTISLALLNALLKFYISELRQQVRETITLWCHEKYMRPKALIFYKANKVGKAKIQNCDHQLTSDVDRFSDTFSDVLSQSLKPIVDFLVYSVELSRVQGIATPLTLYAWFAFASCLSTVTLPPFGELAAREQELEGKFREVHTHMIENCEQVAFNGGEVPERKVLDTQFYRLRDHSYRAIRLSFHSEVVRQYLNKYFVTVIGLFLIGRPLRLGLNNMDKYSADQIAQYFTSTWRNMEAMATAIQDLFELTNRIGKLSGLASRLTSLMFGLENRPPELADLIKAAEQGPYPPRYSEGSSLKFDHVTVYKPDGTCLVRDLNFSVERGQRVLVTGPNGCGKSSLFRVIRKLWPLVEGTITMPQDKDVHFLSQANFAPMGTLRDLVIYPDTKTQMGEDGRTDDEIYDCLEWAHVSPRVISEGRAELEFKDGSKVVRPELDDVRDWAKDLSPGQMQRLAFARLFFHRPSFVILDECTNGISPEVEHNIYDRCTNMNLAVFSISHKIELKLFHDYELHYVGDAAGSWSMRKCSETTGKITRSSSMVQLPGASQSSPSTARAAPAAPGRVAGGQAVIHYERQMQYDLADDDATRLVADRSERCASFGFESSRSEPADDQAAGNRAPSRTE